MVTVSRGTMACAVAVMSILSGIGDARATPSTAYVPPPECPTEPLDLAQDLARRRPNEARYPVCVDQRRVLEDAIATARREGKIVLIQFGAPWCPVCRSLTGALAAMRQAGMDRDTAAALESVVEVSLSLSMIADGKRHDIAATHAILAELSTAATVEPLRAIPYLVVIAPDGLRAVGRNLADLHTGGDGQIDRPSLGRALAVARRHVLDGSPPPPSPRWLARRLRKLGL